MEKKQRVVPPRVRGRRVIFAGLLILGMFLTQAFCHSVAPVKGSAVLYQVSTEHHVATGEATTPSGDSASTTVRSHVDSTLSGMETTVSNDSSDERSTSSAFRSKPCSADGSKSTCSENAVTSCLLILFLTAGLLIPQNIRADAGSSRFFPTAKVPVHFRGIAPNLHALGISRT